MLVNLNDVLIPARRGKYAVGLFNTVNLEPVSYTHLLRFGGSAARMLIR